MALKDILEQIKKEEEAEIAKLNQSREETISKIHAEYKEKRETKKIEMGEKTIDNIIKIKSRAETLAKMENRNNLLKTKRAILQDVFNKTIENLANSAEYVEILVGFLRTAAQEFNDGTVIPTTGKEKEMEKALVAAKSPFKLASKSGNFKGGFLLESGHTEVNFAFDSLLAKELWSELEMQLNPLLFP